MERWELNDLLGNMSEVQRGWGFWVGFNAMEVENSLALCYLKAMEISIRVIGVNVSCNGAAFTSRTLPEKLIRYIRLLVESPLCAKVYKDRG